jgi:hypothetical protein
MGTICNKNIKNQHIDYFYPRNRLGCSVIHVYMRTIFYVVSILFVVLVSCSHPEDEVPAFEIKFGSECGWCAGQEYLFVTESEVRYERHIPCGDTKGTTLATKKLSTSEWEIIRESFDYDLFLTLEYNECNVCVDGCDEIMEITQNIQTHTLRYSITDEIEGMDDLREILQEYLEGFRND